MKEDVTVAPDPVLAIPTNYQAIFAGLQAEIGQLVGITHILRVQLADTQAALREAAAAMAKMRTNDVRSAVLEELGIEQAP